MVYLGVWLGHGTTWVHTGFMWILHLRSIGFALLQHKWLVKGNSSKKQKVITTKLVGNGGLAEHVRCEFVGCDLAQLIHNVRHKFKQESCAPLRLKVQRWELERKGGRSSANQLM